ncbi:MAG TPA: ammonium transporter [Aggregatilineales bacterium]|nr:ammonium transporter [Aggregatilineales bacterium]
MPPLTDHQNIDLLWVIVASGMVFFMQLGFLCLEIGLVQAKNAIDTAVKNVADFVVTSLVFYVVGFGLMFGHSWQGIFGTSDFLISGASPGATFLGTAFIFMQICFAGCAVTIVVGGTAERSDLTTHLLIATVIAAIIYPVFGHWVWGNLYYPDPNGWLVKLGFIDFAGSSVVHGVGGWVTLAGLMAVGARKGRYGPDGKVNSMGGNNIPMAAVGTFILWFGWFGFNGGSLLRVSTDIGAVILKTNFAAAAGGLTSYLYARWRTPHGGLQALPMLSGTLGGMVAITAGSFAVPMWASLVIGGIAGVVVNLAQELLDYLKLDDPCGAVPVHGFCGALGTILTGVFATEEALAAHAGGRIEQIGVQILGSLVCFAWAFGVGALAFWLINKIHPIRVSEEVEQRGLNISEYDDVLTWLDHRKTQQYESTVSTLNELVQVRTKELQSEHDRLDTVLKSMADGLIVTGLSGSVALANPSFMRMFQATHIPMGQPIQRIIDKAPLIHVIEQAVRNVGHTFSTRFDLDGHYFQASSRSVESVGAVSGAVTVIRDVTSEVQAEQSQLDFMSNVSHELRTPLTSVTGFVKMIRQLFVEDLRPNVKPLDNTAQEALDLIHTDLDILAEESERLTRLINDVLDLSRMDSGALNWQVTEVDPLALANQTVALFAAMASEHRLELILDAPEECPTVAADADRLKQVLANLLSNAIKFTKTGEILLRLQKLDSGERLDLWPHTYSPNADLPDWQAFSKGVKSAWLVVSVTDTGIGIAPDKMPVVFERFGQVGEVMTDKPAGTGLGLAICVDIVRRLGGYLWVESEGGKGSRFSFALRLEPVAAGL